MPAFYCILMLLAGGIRDEHNEKISILHWSEYQHYAPFHVPFKIFLDKKDDLNKQPSRSVLRKRCSENMQQIYRRTPMSKCDFNARL